MEKMDVLVEILKSRNPLQSDVLNPLNPYGPCKGNIFIKHLINEPNISIGDYTYAHLEHLEGERVLRSLVPYSFGDKCLVIGNFCSIGYGTQFISPYANHQQGSFTTYPFWHVVSSPENIRTWMEESGQKEDTVVDHDVWFGREAMILPGVHIGSGAVIAARSLVTQSVPPYAVVGGNPAKIIRYRFDKEIIEQLLTIRWWFWDTQKILKHQAVLMGNDLELLKQVSSEPALQNQ